MNICQNSLVKTDYDPATDILYAEYPDLEGALLLEANYSLKLMVEAIRLYDVKKLLLDSSQIVAGVAKEESKQIKERLVADLAKTRVRKVAWVSLSDPTWEITAQENINSTVLGIRFPFQLQACSSREEAMQWLKES